MKWLCLSRGYFRLGGRGRPLRGGQLSWDRNDQKEPATCRSWHSVLAQGNKCRALKWGLGLIRVGNRKNGGGDSRVQRGRGASSPGWAWRLREETGRSLILKHFTDHWVTSLGPAFHHVWSPAQHPPLSVLWTSEPSVARGQVRPLRDIGLLLMWSCGPWADWILRQFKHSNLDYPSEEK